MSDHEYDAPSTPASGAPGPDTLTGSGPPDAEDSLRALLIQVAAGEVDPSEAARLLDAAPPASTTVRSGSVASTHDAVTGVVLRAAGVKLKVFGDPSVATAVADGAHTVRRDGSTLVLESPGGEGYRTHGGGSKLVGWLQSTVLWGGGERVTVRVNPSLPVTLDITGSDAEVTGLRSDVTLAVTGSSLHLREHTGTLHGSASMSSVSLVSAVTGPSDLVSELGSLNLRLAAGHDVTVSALAEMGSVRVSGPGASSASHDENARQRSVVGTGTHPFELTVRMGSANVGAA